MQSDILYKVDSKGKVRQWSVRTEGADMVISAGLQGGKLAETVRTCVAKNWGKSNETTPRQQAIVEANARYMKQINRECYVIKLGDEPKYVQPSLARDATKVGHQIDWSRPWYGQRKLNGVRGIHIPTKEGVIQSRKGIFYKLPHLYEQVEALRKGLRETIGFNFDGEVYKHGELLEDINSACKKANSLTPHLNFHIFDFIDLHGKPLKYKDRVAVLEKAELHALGLPNVFIETVVPMQEKDQEWLHNDYVLEGYEGLMIKDPEQTYHVGERSDAIFKFKKFEDDEFEILDIIPDSKDGCRIVYKAPEDSERETFKSRPKGKDAYRAQLLKDKDKYIGLQGTVRFFSYTKYGVPEFPVTTCIDPDK